MARKTKFSFTQDEQNLKAIGRTVALCCVSDDSLWKHSKHCLKYPADFLRKYLADCVDKISLSDEELSTQTMEALRQVNEWPEYVSVKDRIACWSGFYAVLDERKLTNWYATNHLLSELQERMTSERYGLGISVEHFAQVVGIPAQTIFRMQKGDNSPLLANVLKIASILSMSVETKCEHDDSQDLCEQFEAASQEEAWEQMRVIAENRMRKIKNGEGNGNS